MGSVWPGAFDNFTTGVLTGVISGTDHGNKADAIDKIEAELGLDPSGASATVKARFDAVENERRRWFPAPTGGDDAAELISRLGAGEGEITLRPNTTYLWNQQVAVPAGALIRGAGKHATTVTKNFNGDLMTLAQGAAIEHIGFAGAGATKTGRAVVINTGDGKQVIRSCNLTDFASYCVEFTAIDAGSQFFSEDVLAWQTSGSTNYAVKIPDTQDLSGRPRAFHGWRTEGNRFIDTGGCNTVIVVGGYLGGFRFTADSRGVIVSGARVGVNEATMTVNGHGNVFSGCKINPAVTIAANADQISIGDDNVLETSPYITDSSGNERNSLHIPRQTYTPTWTTGGTAPALGNGSLAGAWSRDGNLISFEIEFTAGTTTTFGTNEFRFALPFTPVSTGPSNRLVPVHFYDGSANTYYIGVAVISAAVAYLTLRADAVAGQIGNAAPFAWGNTDQLRVSGAYQV